MLIIFFTLLIIMLVLYILSQKKYRNLIIPPDKIFYRVKGLIPIGLIILDAFKYRYATTYDRRLLAAIIELYGSKNSIHYLKIHWSYKIVLVLLGLLFSTFIASFSEPDAFFTISCLAILIGIAYLTDRELYEQVKKRRAAIRLDFPDFANKLILLINAGMTVPKAWERATMDSKIDTPLNRELSIALQNIRSGKPEHTAYEEFAKRCRTPEITRFVSVILQNLRKGSSELVPILRVFTNDCWEMRKNAAKRYGEEASTKLLLPLMLMFIAILIIVGTPAVLALRDI